MLTNNLFSSGGKFRQRQSGVVLLFALIVMIAMTLAGLGLMRSVGTAVSIAGNMAFQQAATMAGQSGVESAIAWIEANADSSLLETNATTRSFYAADGLTSAPDPASGVTWGVYWDTVWAKSGVRVPSDVLGADSATGNRVFYVIDRLCEGTGAMNSVTAKCARSPVNFSSAGSSGASGGIQIESVVQAYYRITVRIQGPRNTQSFVQAVVAR